MIIHIDGDAFFASCEQAHNPAYRGKPIITGIERNIVACASYEAKRFGVQRGVPIWQAKQMCPELLCVPSHYNLYTTISQKMFAIMRRFTPIVEPASIDEAFVDITGWQIPQHCSYFELAQRMQQTIMRELGISVSVGLAPSKVLAKLGSNFNKPVGCVEITAENRWRFLDDSAVGDVWGIGPRTVRPLVRAGIHTAGDLARQSQLWVSRHFTKPQYQTWQELNGISCWPVVVESPGPHRYQSISKTLTFTPPSSKQGYVLAQLSNNLERACYKARKNYLAPKHIVVYLKDQQFQYRNADITLITPSAWPTQLMPKVSEVFYQLFIPGTDYRATGVIFTDLVSTVSPQLHLFASSTQHDKVSSVYQSVDALTKHYGHTQVSLASSLIL